MPINRRQLLSAIAVAPFVAKAELVEENSYCTVAQADKYLADTDDMLIALHNA